MLVREYSDRGGRNVAEGCSITETATLPVTSRRSWFALAVLMLGAFMSLLDTTIVNVALQSIRESLDASTATLEWIISGYALAFGLTLIPSGRVGDRFGHKWVFVVGLSLFTLASLACGLAQDSAQLIIARVAQGAAGGIFFPAVTALIRLMFQGRSMGEAFGVLGAVLGLSAALGPIVGGIIIELAGEKLGWRLVFGVNLPIGLLAVIAAILLLPGGSPARGAARVNFFGLLLLTAGLVALLVPPIEGQTLGWPLWTYLSLAGGVLLLVGVPIAVGTIGGAANSARLAKTLGRGVLVLGVGLVTVGLAAIWVVLVVADKDVTNWELLVPLLIAGVGSGFFIAPNTEFIIATVDRGEAGAASGVLGTHSASVARSASQ